MFKKILIALAVAVAIFVIAVSMQPEDFKITRSTEIAAPPAKVYAVVNDIRRWNDWSPWSKLDPGMQTVYEGPATGVGASQSWAGEKSGTGKMTMTQSLPAKLVAFRLDFLKPMESTADVEFNFAPEGKGTQVSWTMSGKNGFISKAFCMFMSMDKMIGPDFEKGLASLKAMVEAKN